MKADKIIKNAKIFTSDSKRPLATALAVKDGKSSMWATKPACRPTKAR